MGKRAIIEALRHYFSTQPVLKAWLFGSFSRGEETKDSDVDIMVSLDKSKPIGLKFFGMWNDLEELLGRKVDLVSEGTLLPFAQESVERDKILVYERTKNRLEHMLQAIERVKNKIIYKASRYCLP
jgi:predicted nucleotidyltransferase